MTLAAWMVTVILPTKAGAWAPEPESRLIVDVADALDVERLRAFPADIEEVVDGFAQIRLPRREISRLASEGWRFTVEIADLRAAHERAESVCGPCGAWHDHDWFLAKAQACEDDHPEICRQEILGASAGGRPIVAVKISDNVAEDEAEPELLFEGSIHGNEVLGAELNAHMVELLTDGYGTDPDITALVNGREVYFVLSTNPDGLCACSRYNDNGVDLNRDLGFAWHADGGSPEPLSQPESRALFDLMHAHSFTFGTSWHGGDAIFLYAWSFTHALPLDLEEYTAIAQDYVDRHPAIDAFEQGVGLYASPYSGSSKDTFYGSFGTLGWTVELADIKAPPFSNYADLMSENEETVLRLIDWAGTQGVAGVFTDARTGDPIPARIEIDGRMMGYAEPTNGDWHRFLLPGVYSATVSANGFVSVNVTDVVVSDGGVADISTTLEPAATARVFAERRLQFLSSDDEWTGSDAIFTLGEPDGRVCPLGVSTPLSGTGMGESFAVMDMGPAGLPDRPGNDITVIAANGTGGYPVTVAAAETPYGPWLSMGVGEAEAGFDLAITGLSAARYFRFENDDSQSPAPGVLIDAVGKPDPRAVFTAGPNRGLPPLRVTFQDASVSSEAIVSRVWDFGDGDRSGETNPTHTYTRPGTYSISLTIRTADGRDRWRQPGLINVEFTYAGDQDNSDDDVDDDADDDADDGDDAGDGTGGEDQGEPAPLTNATPIERNPYETGCGC